MYVEYVCVCVFIDRDMGYNLRLSVGPMCKLTWGLICAASTFKAALKRANHGRLKLFSSYKICRVRRTHRSAFL